ncbi:MAG TPA: hypothetical protein VIX41_08920 [Acidimicrobiales bacterium]
MGDVILIAGCAAAIAALVVVLAAWPRREEVQPVPRRAMHQLLEREAPSESDGTA